MGRVDFFKMKLILLPLVFGRESRTNQELLTALATVQDTLEANLEFANDQLGKDTMDFRLQANKRDIRIQHGPLRKMVATGVNFSFKQLLAAFMRGVVNTGEMTERELYEKSDDQWCGYGCYCTPTQKHLEESDWTGRGEPVDAIDSLCQKLWKCYQCLDLEYKKCPPSTPYGWKAGGKKGVPYCTDNENTCTGETCRCDMAFW